jgi:hypothetical protein
MVVSATVLSTQELPFHRATPPPSVPVPAAQTLLAAQSPFMHVATPTWQELPAQQI